ncbi:MAG: hypothetical protein HC772_02600 [Leptolyngbyaceae cyanobacterium CRU_2_3]|nr:hypothetical protein [Leptolyngbyaceae cyanobacterium CRU_2_3]
MKLGEVLVQRKLISSEQVQYILEHQFSSPKRMGELLLERSLISCDDLTSALKEQYWRDQGYWVIE